MGMIRCVRAALPLLKQAEWARIVNVSAHSTKRQSAHLPAYTAAKSVVTSVTKNLSLSLAPDEILVNTVSPGSFATETLKMWAGSVGIDTDEVASRQAELPQQFSVPGDTGEMPVTEDTVRLTVDSLQALFDLPEQPAVDFGGADTGCAGTTVTLQPASTSSWIRT